MPFLHIGDVRKALYQDKQIYIPKGNLNLSREEMPQIARDDIPEFIDFLKHSDIPVSRVDIPARNLKATQNEFNKEKIRHLMINPPSNKPVIVSDDNHVLDGHHMWLAQLNREGDQMVDCYRVGQDITDLLNTSKQFHKTFQKSIKEDKMIEEIMDHKSLLEKVRKVLREAEDTAAQPVPASPDTDPDDKDEKIKGKKREKILIDPEIRPDKITEPYRVQGSTDR